MSCPLGIRPTGAQPIESGAKATNVKEATTNRPMMAASELNEWAFVHIYLFTNHVGSMAITNPMMFSIESREQGEGDKVERVLHVTPWAEPVPKYMLRVTGHWRRRS